MNTEPIYISQLKTNENNPRTISEEKMNSLVDSILVLPKMLELRPIVVDNTFVALGGNMRLSALHQISKMSIDDIESRLGVLDSYISKSEGEKSTLVEYWSEWLKKPQTPILRAENLTDAEQKEFIIKDNVGFGKWDWDVLASEWDDKLLEEWGMEQPIMESEINMDEFFDENSDNGDKEIGEKLTVIIPYDFKEQKNEIKIRIEETLFNDFQGIKIK